MKAAGAGVAVGTCARWDGKSPISERLQFFTAPRIADVIILLPMFGRQHRLRDHPVRSVLPSSVVLLV